MCTSLAREFRLAFRRACPLLPSLSFPKLFVSTLVYRLIHPPITMLSVYRWATAKDDAPRRPPSGHAVSRTSDPRSSTMSGVTYASKDESRDVHFVCQLPEGSKYAAEAQQLAGSIFSRKPAAGVNRIATDPNNQRTMVEDEQARRRRIDREQTTASRQRHSNKGLVHLKHKEARTDGHHTGHSHAVPCVHPRAAIEVVEEDGPSSMDRRHQGHHRPNSASEAVSPTSSADRCAHPGASQGFRHVGDTHTTYNMRQGPRQLFVSAPTGSDEAAVHNRLAAMAAKQGQVSKFFSFDVLVDLDPGGHGER